MTWSVRCFSTLQVFVLLKPARLCENQYWIKAEFWLDCDFSWITVNKHMLLDLLQRNRCMFCRMWHFYLSRCNAGAQSKLGPARHTWGRRIRGRDSSGPQRWGGCMLTQTFTTGELPSDQSTANHTLMKSYRPRKWVQRWCRRVCRAWHPGAGSKSRSVRAPSLCGDPSFGRQSGLQPGRDVEDLSGAAAAFRNKLVGEMETDVRSRGSECDQSDGPCKLQI